MRRRRLFTVLVSLAIAALAALLLWDPHPATKTSFNRGKNGLWLGHKWYSGVSIRSGIPVTHAELTQLANNLKDQEIRYAFIHVGPAKADGSIKDIAGPTLSALQSAAPQVKFLAWLGARVEKINLADPDFQTALLDSIARLREEGFEGVHFDFEPMRDFEAGYLKLLERVREDMGEDFTISQATPRAGPFGQSIGPLRRSFWSESFYRETMMRSNQTVVMAYDTNLSFRKGYVEFVRHQTHLMAQWACSVPGHEALIGVPAHEDVPTYADPEVENIHNASLGVRAALESNPEAMGCVSGIAVYSNWVTDDSEWDQYRRHWLDPAEARTP